MTRLCLSVLSLDTPGRNEDLRSRQWTDWLLSRCCDQNVHQNGVREDRFIWAHSFGEISAHRGGDGMMMVDQKVERTLSRDSNLQRACPSDLPTGKLQSFLRQHHQLESKYSAHVFVGALQLPTVAVSHRKTCRWFGVRAKSLPGP